MKKDAKTTLLIGYGNPLREDDALGVVVAEHFVDHPRFTVRTAHQLLPEMAEEIAEFDRIFFVDANALTQPGVLAVPLPEVSSALNHTLSPHMLMAYARLLFGAEGKYLVFSAGGAFFGYKCALGAEVSTAAEDLIGVIERALNTP